jgi:hypothetical protein
MKIEIDIEDLKKWAFEEIELVKKDNARYHDAFLRGVQFGLEKVIYFINEVKS